MVVSNMGPGASGGHPVQLESLVRTTLFHCKGNPTNNMVVLGACSQRLSIDLPDSQVFRQWRARVLKTPGASGFEHTVLHLPFSGRSLEMPRSVGQLFGCEVASCAEISGLPSDTQAFGVHKWSLGWVVNTLSLGACECQEPFRGSVYKNRPQ